MSDEAIISTPEPASRIASSQEPVLDFYTDHKNKLETSITASAIKSGSSDAQKSRLKVSSGERNEEEGQQVQTSEIERIEEPKVLGLTAETEAAELHQPLSSLDLQSPISSADVVTIPVEHEAKIDATDAPAEEDLSMVSEAHADRAKERAPEIMTDTHQGERTVDLLQTREMCNGSHFEDGVLPDKRQQMCVQQMHQQTRINHFSGSKAQTSVLELKDLKLNGGSDPVTGSQESARCESGGKDVEEMVQNASHS